MFVFIKSIINDRLLSASTLAPRQELFAQYTILTKKSTINIKISLIMKSYIVNTREDKAAPLSSLGQ